MCGFRDTLEIVKTPKHKKVALDCPEPLLRRLRARRFVERIENAPDRYTGGVIRWTRDELHER